MRFVSALHLLMQAEMFGSTGPVWIKLTHTMCISQSSKYDFYT
jgi:hypothetical protein